MDVFCEICGRKWDSLDPGVRYIYGDGRWECYDEVQCFTRLAAWSHELLATVTEASKWLV